MQTAGHNAQGDGQESNAEQEALSVAMARFATRLSAMEARLDAIDGGALQRTIDRAGSQTGAADCAVEAATTSTPIASDAISAPPPPPLARRVDANAPPSAAAPLGEPSAVAQGGWRDRAEQGIGSGVGAGVGPGGHVDGFDMERMVGGRWAAAIGALVVIVAIGLFLRFAFESGWFGRVPPGVRCLLAALFGGVLLIVGELVHRRINTIAAIGLWIAGLGTIYVTVYAAVAMLALVGEAAGLPLMLAVALGGIGLTWRSGSVTVGAVSLAAGYAAPFLITDGPGPALVLPILLTMLLGIGLSLSAAAAMGMATVRFCVLRPLVLFMHLFAGSLWIIVVEPELTLILVMIVLWWCAVHGESLFASMLGRDDAALEQSPAGSPESPISVAALSARPDAPGRHRRRSARAALGTPVLALVMTAWTAMVGVVSIDAAGLGGGLWSSTLMLGLAVLAIGAITTLGPGVEALRRRPADALDRFAISSWGQAGLLSVAAAAAHFGGAGLTAVWLMIAVLAVELGRRLESRGVAIFGWFVLFLALGKLLTVDLLVNTALRQVLFTDLSAIGVLPTGWSLLALAGAVATLLCGTRFRAAAPTTAIVQAFTAVAAVAIAMGAVHDAAPRIQPLASVLWAAIGVLLVVTGFRIQRQPLRIAGLIVLGMTVLKFLLVDMHGTETIWRILSLLVVGLLLVGVSVVYLRLERATRRGDVIDPPVGHGGP